MANPKHYFYFSDSIDNLLFKNVSVSSAEGMFGLCIGVAVVTFLYEVIKSLRHYLVLLQIRQRAEQSSHSRENNVRTGEPTSWKMSYRLKFHCLQTLLHMLQLAMGYMVMLVVMSYNVWLMVSVILTSVLCFYFHEYVLSRKSLFIPLEIPGSEL